MDLELEIINELIIDEADEILYKKGLYDSLNNFGNPHVSGSYSLNMMTWRDLDIYLESGSMSNKVFFELGKEIAIKLDPLKMSFRNELIGKTPQLPNGLYWGVYTKLFDQQWKIDIWAIDSDEYKQKQSSLNDLKRQIDDMKRKSILKLKYQLHSHPKYRKTFFSVDVYEAVVNNNVRSLNQFKKWLSEKKGITL